MAVPKLGVKMSTKCKDVSVQQTKPELGVRMLVYNKQTGARCKDVSVQQTNRN